MVRTIAFCIVLIAVDQTRAQDVATPDGVAATRQPTVTPPVPQISPACNKPSCPASACNAHCEDQSANQALLKQKLAELNRLQNEVEALRLTTGTPQQILVRVQVVEVSRTKMRRLGMDVSFIDSQKIIRNKQIDSLLDGTGNSSDMRIIDDSDAVLDFVDWLQQKNIARILTRPSIITLSGHAAQFSVGGELPLPARPGSNEAVEFQQFGTQVDVLATALGDNRVRLELRVKVSELDDARSVVIEGTRVPALNVRQCNTPIELEFGQTGVLTGLVEHRVETTKKDAGVPTNDIETELLFMVTPEAVAEIASAKLDVHLNVDRAALTPNSRN